MMGRIAVGALQHVKSGLLDLLAPVRHVAAQLRHPLRLRCTISMALSAEHATVTGNALLNSVGPPAPDDQVNHPLRSQ